ncbi:hypothetical protein P3T76_010911 [Phytophthora citrophthora]|uniref:Uncharacterized protein n=1 Tax=Phytophthora citrophthora TaxID=4793 RepID=A0AAD9GB52_9STRA|nr:hypothetical protein P3T76_010911 [Phytophthora citrophthora]
MATFREMGTLNSGDVGVAPDQNQRRCSSDSESKCRAQWPLDMMLDKRSLRGPGLLTARVTVSVKLRFMGALWMQ